MADPLDPIESDDCPTVAEDALDVRSVDTCPYEPGSPEDDDGQPKGRGDAPA